MRSNKERNGSMTHLAAENVGNQAACRRFNKGEEAAVLNLHKILQGVHVHKIDNVRVLVKGLLH